MDSRELRSVCWFAKSNWFNFRHSDTVFVHSLVQGVTLLSVFVEEPRFLHLSLQCILLLTHLQIRITITRLLTETLL